LIIITELCERYSYYGLRSVLIMYLTKKLNYSDSTAQAIYAYIMSIAYTMPLIGGALADSVLGKFRTILMCSIVYIAGAATLAFWQERPGAFLGLIMICMGTGGIKPNISSFGGDQLDPNNSTLSNTFFNMFYFSINVGSVMSTLVTPEIREHYSFRTAFAIPAVMLCVATLVFFLGRNYYHHAQPQGSPLIRVYKIIRAALRNKNKAEVNETSSLLPPEADSAVIANNAEHVQQAPEQSANVGDNSNQPADSDMDELGYKRNWLDHARAEFPDSDVNDVKQVWRLVPILAFLPIFWTLFDQQGSTWSLQAKKLDLNTFFGKLKPEQMQAMNPILIVCLVPIAQGVVYPFLRRRGFPLSPLNRMIFGMILTTCAFASAGVLDLMIQHQGSGKVKCYYQIPQYVLLSTAELLVSTTGLEFAFTQAPSTMKSTVASLYLLTVAIGDIVAGSIFSAVKTKPFIISYLCAGLMLLNAFIFSFITRSYKFAPGTDPDEQLAQFLQQDRAANMSKDPKEPLLLVEEHSERSENAEAASPQPQ